MLIKLKCYEQPWLHQVASLFLPSYDILIIAVHLNQNSSGRKFNFVKTEHATSSRTDSYIHAFGSKFIAAFSHGGPALVFVYTLGNSVFSTV